MSRLPILLRKPPSRPTNPRTYPKSAQQNESGDRVSRIAHNAIFHSVPNSKPDSEEGPGAPGCPAFGPSVLRVRAALETRGKMGCQGLPTTRKEPPVRQLLISQVHIRQRGCIWRVRSARLRPRRRSRRQSALGVRRSDLRVARPRRRSRRQSALGATEQTRAWRAARCSRSGGCFRGS